MLIILSIFNVFIKGKSADLIIAIFDISQDLKDDDRRILELIANKNAIIVLNKIDLTVNKTTESVINALDKEIVRISALERQGIDDIYEKIVKLYDLNKINIEGENIVTNSRHQYLINQSLNSLEKALETVNSGLPLDIIAIDVRDILMNLGKITGKNVSEDVINEIFSKFCLGK